MASKPKISFQLFGGFPLHPLPLLLNGKEIFGGCCARDERPGVRTSITTNANAYGEISHHHARRAYEVICFGNRFELGTTTTQIVKKNSPRVLRFFIKTDRPRRGRLVSIKNQNKFTLPRAAKNPQNAGFIWRRLLIRFAHKYLLPQLARFLRQGKRRKHGSASQN